MKKIDFCEFKQQQSLLSEFYFKWDNLKMPFRLFATKGEERMKSISGIDSIHFACLFYDWMMGLISGNIECRYNKVCDEFNSIDTTKIKEYVVNNSRIIKYAYEFCNTYMEYYKYFQSTILYLKFNLDIPRDENVNVNWEKIQKVYGDLYEIIGNLFIIPTMINNIKNGRNYDEFQSEGFTLRKYLQSDKAGRAKNFSFNSNLSHLSTAFHAYLRNGTHHKNSYLNSETYEISLGIGKGGTVEKKIYLAQYVHECNELFVSGIILINIIIDMRNK